MGNHLHINQLQWGYNHKPLVKNYLSVDLVQGQFCLVLGANGTGKSTLLQTIGGLSKPLDGTVLLNENPIKSNQCAFVFTQRTAIPFMKVIDLVCSAKKTNFRSYYKKDDTLLKEAIDALMMLGAQDFADAYVDELSDGEFQKVMIARALFKEAQVLLLDEPTAFLDFQSKQHLFCKLKDLAVNENKIIIASTHDPHLAQLFGNAFIVVKNQLVRCFDPKTETVSELNTFLLSDD